MRQMVQTGILGELVHFESFYGYDLAGPFGSVILKEENHWVFGLHGAIAHNNLDHALHKVLEFIVDREPFVCAAGFQRIPDGSGAGREEMIDELPVLISGNRTTA